MTDRIRFVLWILGCAVLVLIFAPLIHDVIAWLAATQLPALSRKASAGAGVPEIRDTVIAIWLIGLFTILGLALAGMLGLWLRFGYRLWKTAWGKRP